MDSELTNALNRILKWIEQHKPWYVEYLQPGLSRAEIEEIVCDLPIQLSSEICELYQWRNGAKKGDLGQETAWLFENWTFKPLREVVTQYQQYLSEKRNWKIHQINTIPYFKNFKILSVFYNGGKGQTGSLWVHDNLEFCPVIFEHFEEGDLSIFQKYTSLTSMMLTMAECYETDAYYIDPEVYGGYFISRNSKKAYKIWRKYNSNIIEFALQSLQSAALKGQFFVYFSDDLIEFKDLRAVKPLVQGLQILNCQNADQFDLLEDPFKYFDPKKQIARILGELGDTRAIPALIAVLKDDDCNNWNYMTKVCAAKALGQLGNEQATYPLIDALSNLHSEVRQMVVWALGQIQDKRAAKPLINALQDSDSQVREAAREALAQLVSKFSDLGDIIPF